MMLLLVHFVFELYGMLHALPKLTGRNNQNEKNRIILLSHNVGIQVCHILSHLMYLKPLLALIFHHCTDTPNEAKRGLINFQL